MNDAANCVAAHHVRHAVLMMISAGTSGDNVAREARRAGSLALSLTEC
jgi:hypothetical protein